MFRKVAHGDTEPSSRFCVALTAQRPPAEARWGDSGAVRARALNSRMTSLQADRASGEVWRRRTLRQTSSNAAVNWSR